jgi:hypothetical protein
MPTVVIAAALSPWIVAAGIALALVAAFAAGVAAYKSPDRRTRPGVGSVGYSGSAADQPDLVQSEDGEALRWLEVLLLIVLAGYLFFDRGFAWFHIPGTPVFVGEIVIAFGIVALLVSRTNLVAIIRESSAAKAVTALMGWGALLLIGALPTWGLDAARDAALWYYGIIAGFVAVLLVAKPTRINSWMRFFGKAIPFFLLWFPVAIILDASFFDRFPVIPDSEIPIVSHRTGNAAVMAATAIGFLWLIDRDNELYTTRQRTWLTALGTVVILFAAMRNRGGFVAAAVALLIAFLFLRRQRSEITMIMVGVVVLLLTVGLVSNLKFSLVDDREVSVDQLMKNLSSVVDQDAGGRRQSTTTQWRLELWGRVLDDVANDRPLAGFGPGPDLGERYDIVTDEDVPLRNPHNSHIGVLARMGFVGVALWAIVWVTWTVELLLLRGRLLARGRTMEAGIVVWLIVSVAAILVNAIFDPSLEGPQVAWWLWGFVGFGIAMDVLEKRDLLPRFTLRRQGRTPSAAGVSAP